MAKRKRETIGLGFTRQDQPEQVVMAETQETRRMGTAEEQLAFLRRFPGPYSVLAEAVVRKVQAGEPVSPDPLLSERSFPSLPDATVFVSGDAMEEEQRRLNEQAFVDAEAEEERKRLALQEDIGNA